MLNGIMFTLGIILILFSRFLYVISGMVYDDTKYTKYFIGAVLFDCIGTAVIVVSLLSNYNII